MFIDKRSNPPGTPRDPSYVAKSLAPSVSVSAAASTTAPATA